ncbi:hypothetical protein L6452_18082 [Arctium lappa]|uniref:Uncharacterized protein n=1 Tax=Arctium lappa TaxID=4217 RepID=A0ACB9C545_ARCLA|nr:hypothetical protein L6452_18082 [Arctium lappa]
MMGMVISSFGWLERGISWGRVSGILFGLPVSFVEMNSNCDAAVVSSEEATIVGLFLDSFEDVERSKGDSPFFIPFTFGLCRLLHLRYCIEGAVCGVFMAYGSLVARTGVGWFSGFSTGL